MSSNRAETFVSGESCSVLRNRQTLRGGSYNGASGPQGEGKLNYDSLLYAFLYILQVEDLGGVEYKLAPRIVIIIVQGFQGFLLRPSGRLVNEGEEAQPRTRNILFELIV